MTQATPDAARMGRRTTTGAAWLVGSRLVARSLDFGLLILISRILSAADFGLIAIAMSIIMIVEAVFELPLAQSLIRIADLRQAHLDTAFTLGMLRGLVLAAVMAALAVPFAMFYGDGRLVLLVCILSIAPAARGMSSPAMVTFARKMSFHRDFMLETLGKLLSALIAIALALWLRNYWAMVAVTVLTPVFTAILSYIFAPYRPRLSLAEWPTFSKFLGWSSAAQVVFAINWQCDRLLLGRLVTPATLGRFAMASDVSALPFQALVLPLLRPLTAAFSLIGNDRARLGAAYVKASSALLMVGLPIMLILSGLAEPAVRLVLSDRWLASADILRWLALAIIPAMFVAPLAPLAMALDRTEIFLRQSAIELVFKLPAIAAGALLFGIPGVIAARLLAPFVMMMVGIIFVRQLTGITIRRQLLPCWRIALSGAVMALTLHYAAAVLPPHPHLAALLLQSLAVTLLAATVYVASLFGLWRLGGCPDGVEAGLFGRIVSSARRFPQSMARQTVLQPGEAR